MFNPHSIKNYKQKNTPYQFIGQNLDKFKTNPQEPNDPVLLSDEQLQSFLINGYLVIETNLDYEFHRFVRDQTNEYFEGRGDEVNPGNNMLPYFPALQRVITDVNVVGALESVLGENYEIHPHKYCHRTFKGKPAQQWHKDSFWGYKKPFRYNKPRYAMIMYYPQKVEVANGPTWVKPRTQYCSIDPKQYKGDLKNKWRKNDKDLDTPVVVKEGSVVMIHYDVVHKGGENLKELIRQMYKIQFVRMEEPKESNNIQRIWTNLETKTWDDIFANINERMHNQMDNLLFNFESATAKTLKDNGIVGNAASEVIAELKRNRDSLESSLVEPVAKTMWDWLNGTIVVEDPLTTEEKNYLVNNLLNDSELVRFYVHYTLARHGEISELFDLVLNYPDMQIKINAMLALSSVPQYHEEILARIGNLDQISKEIVPFFIYISSEMGRNGVVLLDKWLRFLKNKNHTTTLYLTEYLGIVGSQITEEGEEMEKILNALSILLSKGTDHVRFTACLSIARIGNLAYPLIDDLIDALSDHNRYVQGYAITALKRIDNQRSRELLMEYLYYSRYDPISTFSNPF